MYISLIFAFISAALCLPDNSRRLIVPGPSVSIDQAPFAVVVLSCLTGSSGTTFCAQFCSGSLISPNYVLTAGHCVYDASSKFNETSPPVSLDNMYVMVGTADPWNNSTVGQQFVKVKAVSNMGYGQNVRYQADGDLGLLELEECVQLIPGQVETIPVATLDTEPVASNDTCLSINSFGFGISTNLPPAVAYSDGMLRLMDDVLHPFDICQNAFVYGTLALQGFNVSVLDDPGNDALKALFYSYLIPEDQLCYGGNTMHSACLGDSGGGIIANNTIIGVTAFGLGDYCGFGPDYVTRVASHADWILQQLNNTDVCSNWTVSSSFAAWPVLSMNETDLSSSRCLASSWQCGSGECIALGQVCDGAADCSDGSDESRPLCREGHSNEDGTGLTETQAITNAELEDLISLWEANNIDTTPGYAVVVGSLSSVNRPAGLTIVDFERRRLDSSSTDQPSTDTTTESPSSTTDSWTSGSDGSSDSWTWGSDGSSDSWTWGSDGSSGSWTWGSDGSSGSWTWGSDGSSGSWTWGSDGSSNSSTSRPDGSSDDWTSGPDGSSDGWNGHHNHTNCTAVGSDLSAAIVAAHTSGFNAAEVDPSSLLAACNNYTSCVGRRDKWDEGRIELGAFCNDFDNFILIRNQALQFVADFDGLFANPCPAAAQDIPPQMPTDFVRSEVNMTTASPTQSVRGNSTGNAGLMVTFAWTTLLTILSLSL